MTDHLNQPLNEEQRTSEREQGYTLTNRLSKPEEAKHHTGTAASDSAVRQSQELGQKRIAIKVESTAEQKNRVITAHFRRWRVARFFASAVECRESLQTQLS